METIEVKVGDVWADNDPRSAGRTLRVDAIEGNRALCTVLTNSDDTQASLDNPPARTWNLPTDRRGKQVRIKLSRFKPTSTGYRHVGGPDVARMLGGAAVSETKE